MFIYFNVTYLQLHTTDWQIKCIELNCIYSPLIYFAEHAERHDLTPVITSDQPLWWKSLAIQLSQPEGSPIRRLILILGAFHMEMSFLSRIGHLMAGSGIKELFEMIYARKAVKQIMSGKAISRAVCAHLLLDAVLNGLLLYKSMDVPLPCTAGVEQDDAESSDKTTCTNSDLKAADSLYDELIAMTKDADEVANDKAIARIQAIRYGHMDTLAKEPTAILWIQYLDMIRILRNFFTAERLGNWYLHLEAVSEMLPYLAASGHSLYTKSASIYLSSMANLPNDHPVVHQHFVEGLHVARRSDHAWAGLSTDVMIEQVLIYAQHENKWRSDQRQRND